MLMLLALIAGVLNVCTCSFDEKYLVDMYDDLLEYRLKQADEYSDFPYDAKQYAPSSDHEPIDIGSYDHVIVGAGATGTVIANRLSEIDYFSVLVIEAGTFGDYFTAMPGMGFPSMFSNYNWGYYSTPQNTSCLGMVDKKCPLPRGKGYGGTTLINGLAYVRGHPLDFDQWADRGNPGWGYKDVLPYFKKSENFNWNNDKAPVNATYHGTGGYLNVEYHKPNSPHFHAFLQANAELGYNLTDYNSPNQIGVSYSQLNTKKGRRNDGGTAFIDPVKNRRNLKLLTNSYAIKIEIDPKTKRATGILYTHKGKLYRARVNKEAIICAGAFQSPQLLMLSGIGPKKHLEEHNIPVLIDLEVGSGLKDQSQFYGLTFSSNATVPVYSRKHQIRQYLKGYGSLAICGPNEGLGFLKTRYEKIDNYPDLEYLITPPVATSTYFQRVFRWDNTTYEETYSEMLKNLPNSFVIFLINLHQKSVGTVRLKSSSPYDYCAIHTNFLSDEEDHDIDVLYEGIKFVLKLIKTKAFRAINAKLQSKPLTACKHYIPYSKDYWYCSLRQLTANVYHPMCTCPMGSNPRNGDVVDYTATVHGMDNLRVADASVIPLPTSGHPNAVCVMIGEKVSDMIKAKYI